MYSNKKLMKALKLNLKMLIRDIKEDINGKMSYTLR